MSAAQTNSRRLRRCAPIGDGEVEKKVVALKTSFQVGRRLPSFPSQASKLFAHFSSVQIS